MIRAYKMKKLKIISIIAFMAMFILCLAILANATSEKTCYPQSDSRVGSKLCSEGWISLDGFIDEEIVSPEIKDDSDNDKICCPINTPCYKMVGTGC